MSSAVKACVKRMFFFVIVFCEKLLRIPVVRRVDLFFVSKEKEPSVLVAVLVRVPRYPRDVFRK